MPTIEQVLAEESLPFEEPESELLEELAAVELLSFESVLPESPSKELSVELESVLLEASELLDESSVEVLLEELSEVELLSV